MAPFREQEFSRKYKSYESFTAQVRLATGRAGSSGAEPERLPEPAVAGNPTYPVLGKLMNMIFHIMDQHSISIGIAGYIPALQHLTDTATPSGNTTLKHFHE